MRLSAAKRAVSRRLPKPLFEALKSLSYFGRRLPGYETYQSLLRAKKGIEVGGPSDLFKTTLPIYHVVGALDAVNFSDRTVWEGSIRPGRTFRYGRGRTGEQFVCDATDLSPLGSGAYDFVLSSNCLEHIANPIKALTDWRRIIKDDGLLLLVVPNQESNFDHGRPVTKFEHLLDDFRNQTTEHDLTHLDEILALHDLSMDPAAGTFEQFRQRSLQNFDNRTLHHHVFDLALVEQLLRYLAFDLVTTCATKTDFFALAAKTAGKRDEH